MTGFLKIFNHCTHYAGYSARLEVFDSKKSADSGELPLHKIPFANVKSVTSSEVQSALVTIICTQKGERFIFSSSNNSQILLGYCKLLCKLPGCVIPEIPKCQLVSQHFIEQYSDPRKYDASK